MRAVIAALVLGAFVSIPALGQIPQTRLTPTQMKEDLSILRYTFERAHARLYRYSTKAQMDAALDQAERKVGRPMTELEYFRLLAVIIDQVHDAHTSMKPSTALIKYVTKEAKVFPLDVRYADGHAFVEKNLSANAAIPVGGEIVAINGRPMTEITEKVLTVKSADGFNRYPKYEVANVNFWINYLEMVDDAGTFKVEIRDLGANKIAKYDVAGVPAQMMLTGQFELQKHKEFSLEFIAGGQIALMTIPSFGDLALAGRFAEAFRTIKERAIPTLIVDIRENSGGWDELNPELLSYLVLHPFRFYESFAFRAKDWTDLKYVTTEPDDFFNEPDLKSMSAEERKQFVRDHTLAEVLDHNRQTNPAAGLFQSNDDCFAGQLFLLFNGRSASSGGEVPALLHFQGVGTLIGEESNAAYQGTCGGVIPTLTLPHSGFRITFPLMSYQNAVTPGLFLGRGAPPHFAVAESVADAIRERDTVMEFTLATIARRRQ
jgi:hypothetical protein